ncbi:MAG: sigma factor [Polyangiaceae bacterium]|nr:sigma factor [Polyangiaceae bacterium]
MELADFETHVRATYAMAYAVAWRIVRRESDARDVVQDAYATAFRRLAQLQEDRAFPGWLRRIVVTTALNRKKRSRAQWVDFHDAETPPFLDEDETRWTEAQQRLLSRALLTLSREERQLCEAHYYGGLQIGSATERKRLQRIREKLRKEIEMEEQRDLKIPGDLPTSIIELLARPRLSDIAGNPVALTLAAINEAFPGFTRVEVPEDLDLDATEKALGGDAVYIERSALQRISGEHVLRYDLTLPLLTTIKLNGSPQRLWASGKVYRKEKESATHLEAFHQLELFAIDDKDTIDGFWLAGRLLKALDNVLPGREVRVSPTSYPMCSRAFSIDVREKDDWSEVIALGEYAPWVLQALGATARRTALGAGFGLERIAALRYGIDDIRKIATTRVDAKEH